MSGSFIWLDQDKSGDLYITVKLDPGEKEAAERLQEELRGKRIHIEIREEVNHESN